MNIKKYFPITIKDILLSLFILASATLLCFFLRIIDNSDTYVSMIYILAVFLISRYTDGYFYGTVTSLISVLAVNYFFTYPYFYFNFTLSGYPITMICMLAVAVITSALTTQIKQHGSLRLEAEKEKTRSNLLRGVSHDLRTPLTTILGSASAIIDNDDVLTKDERLRLLGGISEDAQWLIRMVENLLSITRIDGENTAQITKRPEAVEELIGESVFKFKKRFPNQSITVKVPKELLIVPMDAMLIEQVIINLLENAVIHGKNATEISIVVSTQDSYAVFELSDNGCGIDENILPNIFEGYYKQAYGNKGDNKRNMGIGLSVCQTIIKAHNGVLTAENKQSGGAVFRFTLPLEEI